MREAVSASRVKLPSASEALPFSRPAKVRVKPDLSKDLTRKKHRSLQKPG